MTSSAPYRSAWPTSGPSPTPSSTPSPSVWPRPASSKKRARKAAAGGATTRLTETGRQRLAEWLSEPVATHTEFRDLGLLKLFFAELAEPEAVLALAREQVTAQRAQLAHFEAILERYSGRPELASRVLPAKLGARVSHAAAEFWEDIAERQSQADNDADAA